MTIQGDPPTDLVPSDSSAPPSASGNGGDNSAAAPPTAGTPALHQGISPKLSAAALGGAIATLVGIGVAHLIPAITTLELTGLVGAVGTLFTFLIGYYLPDPLRHAGSVALAAH